MEAADREIEYYLSKQVSFYLPTMNEIREALSLSKWGAPWNNVKANLTASHLTHVLHTGQRLKDISPECLLKADDLESILKSVEELRQTIEELDIPEVAKHKLRQRCGSLHQAVEEYRFWGVDGIEVSFEVLKARCFRLSRRTKREFRPSHG